MARSLVFLAPLLFSIANAQNPSSATAMDTRPKLKTWKCTASGGCKEQNTALVLDALSHPVHQASNPRLGCGNWGSGPNSTACPDLAACQKNCVMDPITDYTQFGINTMGGNLHLKQIRTDGSVASPRVYLLAENEKKYEMLKLIGGEFSFDVDVSKLPCGMNGALYLSEMEEDGGMAKNPLNTAGPPWGTGYCDAQCFTTPFINGVGNIDGKGACCNEMDIWEANAMGQQLAPHVCNQTGLYKCTGTECAMEGVCDKNGCGLNPYRLGNKKFYGPDLTVNTKKPFTVVTQFPADKDGNLVSIKRFYIQDGKIIQNAVVNVTGPPAINYITDEYCSKTGARRYMDLGSNMGMGQSLARGMVLIFSIWWDEGGFMKWLDSAEAGPCGDTDGDPNNIRKIQPDTDVTFSAIKWGEIDSTYTKPM